MTVRDLLVAAANAMPSSAYRLFVGKRQAVTSPPYIGRELSLDSAGVVTYLPYDPYFNENTPVVYDATWSKNGRLAVARSDGCTVYTLSGSSYTAFAATNLAFNTVYGVSLSEDATYLAVIAMPSSDDGTRIQVFKLVGGTYTRLSLSGSTAGALAYGGCRFDPTGAYLARGGYNDPVIWKRTGDTFTQLTVPTSGFTNHIVRFAISAGGTYFAFGAGSGGIKVYKRSGDTFTIVSTISLSSNSLSLAFSPDNTYLAYTNDAYTLKIAKRSGDTFTEIVSQSAPRPIECLEFSPDGKMLFMGHNTGGYGGVIAYDRSGDTFTQRTEASITQGGFGQGAIAFYPRPIDGLI